MCKRRHDDCGSAPRHLLEDELGRCLCFLDVEPAAYPAVAREWAARLLGELPLTLNDRRLLLAGLDALAKTDQARDLECLLTLFQSYGLSRSAQIMRAWMGLIPNPSSDADQVERV